MKTGGCSFSKHLPLEKKKHYSSQNAMHLGPCERMDMLSPLPVLLLVAKEQTQEQAGERELFNGRRRRGEDTTNDAHDHFGFFPFLEKNKGD